MAAPVPDGDVDPKVRFLQVDGLRIQVADRRGNGPPLLLIMGIGGNLRMWTPLDRALRRRGVHTIAYDAPGTGGSSAYRFPRRVPALAGTVEHLLDALGLDRVDVLGVSFGGVIAQQLAHQAPRRVWRLVLAATTPGLGGVPGRPRALLALATPRRYLDPGYLDKVAADVYGGRARQPGGAAVLVAHVARPPSLPGYLAQLAALPGWSSLPWLRRITHPTLVLAGDDDPIVPLINAKILAARIPGARLHVVAGGGHLFLLERAEESAAVVADFLTEAHTQR